MNDTHHSPVTDAVRETIHSQRMIRPGETVLLAFSGGTDSSVLYEILKDLQTELGFTLFCAHLDHGFRESSAEERKALQKRCENDGIRLYSARIDARTYAEENGLSEEEAGRELRYRYFDHLMKTHDFNHLALAHHENDQAETLLFRLSRGCGLQGAGAMKRVQQRGVYTIIRPMLGLGRREIEEELTRRKAPAIEDESNASLRYARNRIRHQVLPELEAVHPGAVASLARSADIFQEEGELLEMLLAPFCQKFLISREKTIQFLPHLYEDKLCSELSDMEKRLIATPAFRYAMIREGARRAGIRKDLSQTHVHAVDALFRSGKTGTIDLPAGYQAGRGQKRFWIGKKTEKTEQVYPLDESVFTKPPGHEIFYENGRRVSIAKEGEMAGNATHTGKKFNKYTLDYDMINNSLLFRRRQPGDYIIINQGKSKKKLKRFFIDNKIDKQLRDDLLMLADGSEILWIPGLYARNKKLHVDLKKIDAKELHLVAEGYEYD